MSFDAIRWALDQQVDKASAKFVLVAMADCVPNDAPVWECFASYRYLAARTGLDAKTVEAAVTRLKNEGFIVDTGQRRGETGKVVVYRLNDPKSGVVTQGPHEANGDASQHRKDPEFGGIEQNGNPPKFPANPPKFPIQRPQFSGVMTPKTGYGSKKETKREEKREGPSIPGVAPELVADWLAVRKAKRAGPLTGTAINALVREANKAGLSLTEAVTFCCEASWVGFNSGWYLDRIGKSAGEPAKQETFV